MCQYLFSPILNILRAIIDRLVTNGKHAPVAPDLTHLPLSQDGGDILDDYFKGIFFNTSRARQNGCHFADYIFKCIFLNENVSIPIKISLKIDPKGPITHVPALVQIMAWHRPSDKPLSEPMMVNLLTHICITRPQWVHDNIFFFLSNLCQMFPMVLCGLWI